MDTLIAKVNKMSIKAFGVLELSNNNLPLEEEIQIFFGVVENAIKNKFGVNLGGNVSSSFRKSIKNLSEKIPFELIDNPMDVNATGLFAGNGIHIGDIRVDTGESLSSRMSRVQNFLNEVLKIQHVNKIVLDIDIESGDEFETIKVSVNNF